MKTDEPKKIYLKDYRPSDFIIEKVNLEFDLDKKSTQVTSKIIFKKINPSAKNLELDGVNLKLKSILIDQKNISDKNYKLSEQGLEIYDVPVSFELQTTVEIDPSANTSLEGLYSASGGLLCTQCEPQGFRKITYFLDRPDIMTKFEVALRADNKIYPVLLSNGDCVRRSQLPDGRQETVWIDPFKKPCYLFALVAGDLGKIESDFMTASGKKVKLEIYSPYGSQNRCIHAMESLKKSMAWDETRFGREYDLSTYMIVATDDFNAGAMENKGLNIFNSRLVLADEKSATDNDYFAIESVIAHEYFHNWTGNRVTLRDWFHLSLKEGLTVFRDQEFSMDMSSRSVVRIDSVSDLRNRQFLEDAGPNAHPIRPESCFAVDNFFTSTIYEKGAEVIRMMQTMVGRPGFRKGMDLYFSRYDGQAVIIEDFAKAIADANNQSWEQFNLWYSQSGTPKVRVLENYNSLQKTYDLTLSQECPLGPGEKEKKPFFIPLTIELISPSGKEIQINHPQIKTNTEGQKILFLSQVTQKFIFEQIHEPPTLSLNRQFSAPIHLEWNARTEDLLRLLKFDTDDFNRWESGQKLAQQILLHQIDSKNFKALTQNHDFLEGLSQAISSHLDPAMKAMILELPSDAYLLQFLKQLESTKMEDARNQLELAIASYLKNQLHEIYHSLHGKNTHVRSPKIFAERRLKNTALQYLTLLDEGQLAFEQFSQSKIMTDQQAALACLSHLNHERRHQAFELFYQQWKSDALVMNKWFALQGQSTAKDTFENIIKLWNHPDFNIKNPNRVYSLLLRYGDNLIRFHDPDKNSYDFFAEKIIELDKLNPQVATRIASVFNPWIKLPEFQKAKARVALEKIIATGLSKNTYEIVSKSLAAEK